MNLAACAHLRTKPENGTWYRAIDPKFLATALNTTHTAAVRSRYNAGPLLPTLNRFEILYFADDPLAAAFETGWMLGQLWKPGTTVAHPRHSALVTINIDVVLDGVVDLTDVAGSQQMLKTTAQELTGDWDCYEVRSAITAVSAPTGVAPTQELGKALYMTSGVEAFLTVSAKVPYQRNLVVFPKKLGSRSQVLFRDFHNPNGPPLLSLP